MVVLPYFLFTGKLYKRVMEIVRSIEEQHPEVPFRLTPCFGLNPLVLEVLEQRVAEAEAGTFTAYDQDWMRGLAKHRYTWRKMKFPFCSGSGTVITENGFENLT